MLRLSEALAVAMEIADKVETIQTVLPILDQMAQEAIITLAKLHSVACRYNETPP
jgi:PII-like signaling protein